MQGLIQEMEEEEQYMTFGEDGRPYIAVRRKQEERKENEQERVKPAISDPQAEEDVIEEEEQYLTIGKDGRPYIAVRIKRSNKLESTRVSVDVDMRELKTTVSPGIEDADVGIEEEVINIDEETESLIRKYQRSAIPESYNLRLIELYGGEDWRKDEGAEMKR